MGIDVHALNLVRYAAAVQPLGDVVTVGRQAVHLAPSVLRGLLGPEVAPLSAEHYCERLLVEHLGAESVDSIDYSNYEGATHIADLNRPLHVARRYDTVLDAGTLEHIFDIRQALANVSALCTDGGQILHVLPANNQNGHGFWQFSPELFFSLYSRANGYRDTRVFVASEALQSRWYEVLRPPAGQRVNFTSVVRSIVLVRTVRAGMVSDEEVQQSDYVAKWSDADGSSSVRGPTSILKTTVDRYDPLSRLLRGSYARLRAVGVLSSRLSGRHPQLRRVNVKTLIASR